MGVLGGSRSEYRCVGVGSIVWGWVSLCGAGSVVWGGYVCVGVGGLSGVGLENSCKETNWVNSLC